MTFGEKLVSARLAHNLTQLELAEKIGVSERSVYSYEQEGTIPRKAVMKKIAETLNVSYTYLSYEAETDKIKNIDEEMFVTVVKDKFGSKGAREAQAILDKTTALFAGGDLDDEAKDIFIQSLMEVYMESKAEAREKFAPKQRKSRNP